MRPESELDGCQRRPAADPDTGPPPGQAGAGAGAGDEADLDGELLTGSVDDHDLFGQLFARHREAVLVFFVRRTACAQTAADLTAETFAQAFASRRRYAPTGAPARAWLFAIARRHLAKYLRRERVSARYRRKLGLTERADLTASDYERIEELADLDPHRRAVRAALHELPDGQREAVWLRVGLDLPYDTVAERLECSPGAARVRVSRALTALADQLEGAAP